MLYPSMSASRFVLDLSGIWSFKLDDGEGFSQRWYETILECPMTMPVPSSYNDMKESELIRDHYGWVFYQRIVSIPRLLRSERVVLRMDGATHKSIVYWNGVELKRHQGGFLPYEVELVDWKEEENILTIAIDNRIDHSTLPVGSESYGTAMLIGGNMTTTELGKRQNKPNFDFFNYAGLTRPVRIYTTPKYYIKDITLITKIENNNACIEYKIETAGEIERDLIESISICTHDGREVGYATGSQGTIHINDAILWEPLKPYLYHVTVRTSKDIYTLPYGLRTVSVDGGKFLINNKPFYFKGYGKHEDTYPAGRGLNEPMNVKDISLMKWQGANSFRTSHYPYSEEMMRLCDMEGIVVIDETPAVGLHLNFGGGANFKDGVRINTFDPIEKGGIRTFDHHMETLETLIKRDKNYACVVMWSIANEADSASEGAYDYFKPLFDKARKSDPQKRPCTIVGMQVEDNLKDCTLRLSDVYCLNRYYGWYVSGGNLEVAQYLMMEEMQFWNSTGKPVIMTEYGADTVSGFHDTVPVMFTEEYQIEYYKMNHRVMDQLENFVGEHAWNFADFATSQGIMRVQGNKKGIFTRDRRPKMIAHYFKERWSKV